MITIFLLYNLRSAFNVGSIFRTGEFLGFRDFILVGYTPGLEHKDILKTSLGAEKKLNIIKRKRIFPLLKKFKKEGYQIISLEQDKRSLPFYKFQPKNKKLVFILGNEVEGISKKVLNFSDQIIEIPKIGQIKESLNVAITFAIFASYLRFFTKN